MTLAKWSESRWQRMGSSIRLLLSAVPEPSTYAMLLLGGFMTYGFARRRRS